MVAYHEAGHALVRLYVRGARVPGPRDPPRCRPGGHMEAGRIPPMGGRGIKPLVLQISSACCSAGAVASWRRPRGFDGLEGCARVSVENCSP